MPETASGIGPQNPDSRASGPCVLPSPTFVVSSDGPPGPLFFFDLETTALRPDRGGRIREMAVVDVQGLRFDWRSDATPPRDDAVAHQLPRLVDHLEAGIVVGHNLQFDFRFVTYES